MRLTEDDGGVLSEQESSVLPLSDTWGAHGEKAAAPGRSRSGAGTTPVPREREGLGSPRDLKRADEPALMELG